MTFNIGDVVRVKKTTSYLFKDSPWRKIPLEVKGYYNGYVRVLPLENVDELSDWVNLSSLALMAGFPESELEMAKEPTTMNFDEARASKARIVKSLDLSEKRVRVRSRNWDTDGLYAAVDILDTNNKTVLKKLYNRRMVDDYITEMQTPIDVIGVPYDARTNDRFVFYTPEGVVIYTSDGNHSVWRTDDVINAKGLVEYNGKRYRLGKPAFEPFV